MRTWNDVLRDREAKKLKTSYENKARFPEIESKHEDDTETKKRPAKRKGWPKGKPRKVKND